MDVDGPSGRVAYLAGSVVVLLDDDGNQTHIVNETKKAFTSVAFSVDGKSLLTGKHLWLVSCVGVARKCSIGAAKVPCG